MNDTQKFAQHISGSKVIATYDGESHLKDATDLIYSNTLHGIPTGVEFSSVFAIIANPWISKPPPDIPSNHKLIKLHKHISDHVKKSDKFNSHFITWGTVSLDWLKLQHRIEKENILIERQYEFLLKERDAPFGALIDFEDVPSLIDWDRVPKVLRKYYENPDKSKNLFGNIMWTRIPVKEMSHMQPKIISETNRLQVFSFIGSSHAYHLERNAINAVKSAYPDYPPLVLITSGNPHGDKEITARELERLSRYANDTSEIMNTVIIATKPEAYRNNSYPILDFNEDSEGFELVRQGNMTLETLREVYSDIPITVSPKTVQNSVADLPPNEIWAEALKKYKNNPSQLRNIFRELTTNNFTNLSEIENKIDKENKP